MDSPEMSTTAASLSKHAVELFEALKEHDKQRPDEVIVILGAMVAHVRSWKPFVITASTPPETASV